VIFCKSSKQEILSKTEKRNQKIRENPNNIKYSDFVNWLESNGFILDRVVEVIIFLFILISKHR